MATSFNISEDFEGDATYSFPNNTFVQGQCRGYFRYSPNIGCEVEFIYKHMNDNPFIKIEDNAFPPISIFAVVNHKYTLVILEEKLRLYSKYQTTKPESNRVSFVVERAYLFEGIHSHIRNDVLSKGLNALAIKDTYIKFDDVNRLVKRISPKFNLWHLALNNVKLTEEQEKCLETISFESDNRINFRIGKYVITIQNLKYAFSDEPVAGGFSIYIKADDELSSNEIGDLAFKVKLLLSLLTSQFLNIKISHVYVAKNTEDQMIGHLLTQDKRMPFDLIAFSSTRRLSLDDLHESDLLRTAFTIFLSKDKDDLVRRLIYPTVVEHFDERYDFYTKTLLLIIRSEEIFREMFSFNRANKKELKLVDIYETVFTHLEAKGTLEHFLFGTKYDKRKVAAKIVQHRSTAAHHGFIRTKNDYKEGVPMLYEFLYRTFSLSVLTKFLEIDSSFLISHIGLPFGKSADGTILYNNFDDFWLEELGK